MRAALPTDDELSGLEVLVCGLGLFGGGAAVVRFLAARGANVTITDLRTADDLAESLAALDGVPFRPVLGEHRARDFQGADLVVVNPAVPLTSPYLAAARAAGVPWTSEVALTFDRLRARLVLVTGSKGKSTTAALLREMVAASGREATLAGNVGHALVETASTLPPEHVVVFEISSFQLEQIAGLPRRPEAAVVTNLFPVHLDRHRTFDAYRAVKRTALAGAGAAVLNAADDEVRAFADGFDGPVEWFDPAAPFVPVGELRVRGAHNATNATAAWCAARRLGVEEEVAAGAARGFEGLPHRLRTVHREGGVTWVDDSIATSPRATCAALEAVSAEGPIVLIVGGVETDADLADLPRAAADRARVAITAGETAERLARALRGTPGLEVVVTPGLDEAVAAARARARPGDVVLLSPGFPSYDGFRNFTERGERFRWLAMQSLKGGARPS